MNEDSQPYELRCHTMRQGPARYLLLSALSPEAAAWLETTFKGMWVRDEAGQSYYLTEMHFGNGEIIDSSELTPTETGQ